MTKFKFSAVALWLLALLPNSHVKAQADGDTICVDGYIMDRYCIDRGTLLDASNVVTLEEPERHSIHCLVDVGVCNSSPFHILQDPPNEGDNYGEGWSVTDNKPLMDLARSVGSCSTCTGEGDQRAGFRAAVRGVVENAGDRILRIEEVALTGTDLCEAAACPTDVMECPDGSSVGRVPPDCEFEDCPEIACPSDIQECPDGSTVVRIPPDCDFEECPEIACPSDILECPDGSTVVRQPPDCEFEECPTLAPTESPTTLEPTESPTTLVPTESPTTLSPTESPTTLSPTMAPSASPSEPGTAQPSSSPSRFPSTTPSASPSRVPSTTPSASPSAFPTDTMPSVSPSAMPSVAPTMGSNNATNETLIDCTQYQYALQVPGLDNVTMEYVVNYHYYDNNSTNLTTVPMPMMHNFNNNETMLLLYGTMSVRIEYQGQGWIGFAVSPLGGMLGSDAVIGVPADYYEEENGNATLGNVSKYHLTFEGGAPGYLLMEDEQQTLMDAYIWQDENSTVLEFTRLLVEEGEVPINGTGFNYFLIAHGTETNELGYHGMEGRSSFNLTLSPCMMGMTEEDEDYFPDMEGEVLPEPPVLEDMTDEETEVERGFGADIEQSEATTTSDADANVETTSDTSGREPAGAGPLESTSGAHLGCRQASFGLAFLAVIAALVVLG